MADIIREAPLGQIIRWATSNKFLKYPEEEPNFQCPNYYLDSGNADSPPVLAEEKEVDISTSVSSRGQDAGDSGGKQ